MYIGQRLQDLTSGQAGRAFFSWVARIAAVASFIAGLHGAAQAQRVPVAMNAPTALTAPVVVGATSVDLTFTLSAMSRVRLSVIVPVNGASLTLFDPSGLAVISPGDSRIEFDSGHLMSPPRPGGVYLLPDVLTPANGLWRLRVAFPAAVERTAVFATLIAASRYEIGVAIDRDVLVVGEDAAIGVAVQDNGLPVGGLSPRITISRVSASSAPTTLVGRDDGVSPDGRANDGVYSVEQTFSAVGEYDIRADVTINTPSGPVLRTAMRRVRVETPAIAPPVVSLVNVLGSGGCVNGLRVNVNLTTNRTGSYSMLVRLRGPQGQTIDFRRVLTLNEGSSSTFALFSAQEIRQQIGTDGPYAVSLIDFLDVGGDEFSLVFRRRDVGTFNVAQANLCTLPIELPGPLTVTPVMKGSFIGSLNFSFPVRVSVSGSYQISFKVVSASGADFGLLNASRSLSAGVNTVTVNLAHMGYLTNDGPYQAISLLVLSGGNSATQSVVGSSAAYSRWQFAPRVNGDLNNDGSVDAADNAILVSFRGIPALSPGDRRDLNRDGIIDLRDARELQRLACIAPNCPVNP